VHFTPSNASWPNQVKRWSGHVTQRAIRRGSFRTVRGLLRRIDAFVAHNYAGAGPFAWTATADSIRAKLQCLLQAIYGTPR
jgi:putative transposase